MRLTAHAAMRATQRSVPHDVVRAIQDYGSASHSRRALSICLDREALAFASDALPPAISKCLSRYLGVYIIEDGDSVITVARAFRRRRQ